MKTIGEFIKSARIKKKYSLNRIEEMTKIRSEFVDALEKNDWGKLPNFSTTLGFIKSVASFLEIDDKTAVALFKRDYPPRKQNINPKPDIIQKFVWSPKFSFTLGVSLIVIVIMSYLGLQYVRFTSAPQLAVETPIDNTAIDGRYIVVSGKTDTDAKIIVNNQPVLVDPDGKFVVGLEVSPETQEIIIIATGRSGKITEIRRKVLVTNN